MGETKTAYEWAIEKEIRIIGLRDNPTAELDFYTVPVEENWLKTYVDGFEHEEGKLHLKSNKYLELRMYTLVPYNILGIQMGIQHEHSVTQFSVKYGTGKSIFASEEERYNWWANEWKTSIVLNGGTSNEGHNVRHGFGDVWYVGSMQQHLKSLIENDIKTSSFYEPDLNNMLTGISFIVDERVFNKHTYPNLDEMGRKAELIVTHNFDTNKAEEEWQKERAEWVKMIGGEQNAFLRVFLSKLKLARG